MTSAREQVEELVADFLFEQFNDDNSRSLEGWSRDWWRTNLARPLLDALLAATQEQTCPNPECDDGLVYYGTDEHGGATHCDTCGGAGVVPGAEPLIILGPERVPSGLWDEQLSDFIAVYRDRRAGSPDE